jgi:peptidoglycan/xylan/chitin deacetylase (PgdA/CDA1 family)
MYHSLDDSGSVTSVAPQVFEAQMAGLAESQYRVMSLRDALAERDETGDWPDRSAVLTFDDGYANVHAHALPVLQRYGFGATVFVVTGHVGGQNDWSPPDRRLGVRRMLSWRQAGDLADHGVEIGAHTLSHADLPSLDPEALEREIAGSAQEIGAQLGEPARTFAYPFGSISDQAVSVVERTFLAACTTVHRRASGEPRALLPRVEMYYFRTRQDLRPLVSGKLDRALALRRWARNVRRFLPRPAGR